MAHVDILLRRAKSRYAPLRRNFGGGATCRPSTNVGPAPRAGEAGSLRRGAQKARACHRCGDKSAPSQEQGHGPAHHVRKVFMREIAQEA